MNEGEVQECKQTVKDLSLIHICFGDERLFAEGKAWILTRMAFRIKDLPSPGDKVNIRTWPAKLEHLGHRGYEVYNASDELIVAAVSAWTVLDLSTRRLTALPEELAAVYPVNTICLLYTSRFMPLVAATCSIVAMMFSTSRIRPPESRWTSAIRSGVISTSESPAQATRTSSSVAGANSTTRAIRLLICL